MRLCVNWIRMDFYIIELEQTAQNEILFQTGILQIHSLLIEIIVSISHWEKSFYALHEMSKHIEYFTSSFR